MDGRPILRMSHKQRRQRIASLAHHAMLTARTRKGKGKGKTHEAERVSPRVLYAPTLATHETLRQACSPESPARLVVSLRKRSIAQQSLSSAPSRLPLFPSANAHQARAVSFLISNTGKRYCAVREIRSLSIIPLSVCRTTQPCLSHPSQPSPAKHSQQKSWRALSAQNMIVRHPQASLRKSQAAARSPGVSDAAIENSLGRKDGRRRNKLVGLLRLCCAFLQVDDDDDDAGFWFCDEILSSSF